MDDEQTRGMTYRDAGVDIDAQDEALRRIKQLVASTRTPGVLSDIGAFGGVFAPSFAGFEQPLLVSSADGVGTKLQVAFRCGVHHTVGRDLVHHCINDILVQGARPLFFLDYIATGRLDPPVLAAVVEGVAGACREHGCALLGGETAEMPGFYADGEYDLAGFIVGAVDRPKLLGAERVRVGDKLIGLASSGLHTNGYSLARKVFFEHQRLDVGDRVEQLGGTVGELLLAVHRCYLPALGLPLERGWVRALAHVTGGGLTDNVPRSLPVGCGAEIRRGSWPVPPIFGWLADRGKIAIEEMYRAFNMGLGMVLIASPDDCPRLERHFDDLREPHFDIGRVVDRGSGVSYVD
ncbi:MAG TPA: phosphoribosylformylglycinamidine cyclo-ligase [Candidatus Polarisedimenticolaceae bacterium]|nr:phosphoribosylformylglycinamidine cyclo-ligase [Candidatus Polarisedimenticolaceae bacterium]